jgi:DNA-binding winged helix-turn-helix (wHTH) protein
VTAVYQFGRFELSPATRQLLLDNQPAPLGARAFDVLLALVERRDRLVTKNELLDLVWPGLVVEENNLQVQISALRKLLGQEAIATIPGRGYRFTVTLTGSNAFQPLLRNLHADPRWQLFLKKMGLAD